MTTQTQAAAPSAREPMLSAQDLAAQLNMSVPAIYRRRARGEDLPRALQLTRGGALRWRQSDVDAWVEAHLDPLP